MADKVTFEIIKKIAVIREANENGWTREVNIVKWNDYEPKVDVRDWDAEHKKMSKGITMTTEEALKMAEMIMVALG